MQKNIAGKNDIKIVKLNVRDLKPAEYNPRKWSEESVKNLKKSIEEFGLVDPIIVNAAPKRKNIVIGGHFRLKIAKDLGFKEVPVVYVNVPDIKKEQELNLRLNKNLGDWDWDLLANIDDEILTEVGFSSEELDNFFGLQEDDFDSEKEYNSIDTPRTQLGDLFQLGDHRLLCGDSEKTESFKKLLGEEKSQLVFTDPPYNVGYDYRGVYTKGKKANVSEVRFNDNKKPEDFKTFIYQVFKNCGEFCKENSPFYCWHASKMESWVRGGA